MREGGELPSVGSNSFFQEFHHHIKSIQQIFARLPLWAGHCIKVDGPDEAYSSFARRPLWAGHCINIDGPHESCSRELELVCAAALALEAVRKPTTGRLEEEPTSHHSPRSTALSPALNRRMITTPPTEAFLTTSFSKDKVRISIIKINNLAWIFESPLKNTCDFIS